MIAIEHQRYGVPEEVAEVREVAGPGKPEKHEVLVAVEACPINPSDLLRLRGAYGDSDGSLPAPAGSQGIGRVTEVGQDVTHLKVGDLVALHTFFAGEGIWRDSLVHRADRLQALPEGDILQLAMISGNPPSAWLLLKNYMALQPGDWVIQNAANSTVGQYLVQLAKALELNTINVVRRSSAMEVVSAAGADHVLLHDQHLRERVLSITGGKLPRLAVDAVAGENTEALANCLQEGSTIVSYGLLSGEPCQLHPRHPIFRDIRVEGFWLQRWWSETPQEEINRLMQHLGSLIANGQLKVPVEAIYPFDRVKEALSHAESSGRDGKIFLTRTDSRYVSSSQR